jgi:superfamily II DNA or RNA helicase
VGHAHAGIRAIDREVAAAVLSRRLDAADIRAVLDRVQRRRDHLQRKTVEWIVAETEHAGALLQSRLPERELAGFLVDLTGPDLLAGRELRLRLARRASPEELDRLYEYPFPPTGRGPRDPERAARIVARRNWHPGKSWARYFTGALDFPPVFAGLPGPPTEPDAAEVQPFRPLKPLEEFQDDLKGQVLAMLSSPAGQNRGILTLPTGAGKTRTAVESLTEWRLAKAERAGILWIAQSDELCEQAVQAFREVWIDQGHRPNGTRESMTVSRLWGAGRAVPLSPDVVVASIQKLQAICRGKEGDARRNKLSMMANRIGAVVVDEAHRILAPGYSQVLEFIGIDTGHGGASAVPLLGLTATPFRGTEAETCGLAARFHGRLLQPGCLGSDPVAQLRSRGVLARPIHQVISHGGRRFEIESNPRYRKYFERFSEFHPAFLGELGQEQARNRTLLHILCELPREWPVLFFGCSVEHATAVAVLLRRRGRAAATVTSSTRSATRRALIEEFRTGRISVLCNYGVLTTGFDAPTVRALVIARPTASRVLYEQMIGRGMRGPAFGGTDECLVIDVEDNIDIGGRVAFTRYEEYWAAARPGPIH